MTVTVTEVLNSVTVAPTTNEVTVTQANNVVEVEEGGGIFNGVVHTIGGTDHDLTGPLTLGGLFTANAGARIVGDVTLVSNPATFQMDIYNEDAHLIMEVRPASLHTFHSVLIHDFLAVGGPGISIDITERFAAVENSQVLTSSFTLFAMRFESAKAGGDLNDPAAGIPACIVFNQRGQFNRNNKTIDTFAWMATIGGLTGSGSLGSVVGWFVNSGSFGSPAPTGISPVIDIHTWAGGHFLRLREDKISRLRGSMTLNADADPATSAALDIQGTNKALLISRLTTAERDALTPVDGMLVYNTTTAAFNKRQAGAWVAF